MFWNKKKCVKCKGFGWKADGILYPITELDYKEMQIKQVENYITKCPWCEAGKREGVRYNYLKDLKLKEDTGQIKKKKPKSIYKV